MRPTKRVFYDTHSINPQQGDTVEILIHHHDQKPERLTATFMGGVQLASYTTPYFKFLIGDEVRLINANAIREWRYSISPPSPNYDAPQLPGIAPVAPEEVF